MGLFSELKRRNVFRVGIAYAIATWLLLQITDVITPILALPEWAPKLIFVILAIGFVPALIFAWAFELTPEGLIRENEVDRQQSITRQTGRKLDYAIIATLSVAVILLVIDRQSTDTPEIVQTSMDRSIAVLPFVNMSSDEEQEYFSDGITEEILNSLAAVKELKVAGRTSSFAFKGQNDDLRRIGDALGVDHILEGSVRKAGTKVRITAQLIQVDDGFHLWSETYDRELDDIFEIQDEIAREILARLKEQLLDEDIAAIASDRTNTEAYQLYMLARQRIYERREAQIIDAGNLLDRALELDPEYAPAVAQRGIVHILLAEDSYGDVPVETALERADSMLRRALELDPDQAEAWAGLGLIVINDRDAGNSEEAVTYLTRALELNPNLIDASNWLQIALGDIGDLKGNLNVSRSMLERDPLYRPAFGNAISTLNNFGYRDEAEQVMRRFESFNPEDPSLLRAKAMHHFYVGESGTGLEYAERALAAEPNNAVMQFTLTIGLNQTGQFERLADEDVTFFKPIALLTLGRTAEALAVAQQEVEEGYVDSLFVVMAYEGQFDRISAYIDELYGDLDNFSRRHPAGTFSHEEMSLAAYAYLKTGEQEKFQDAIERAEAVLAQRAEAGITTWLFDFANARVHALRDNRDSAFAALNRAVDTGMRFSPPIAIWAPELSLLAGDPRFEEFEVRLLDAVNVERVRLGLEPLAFEVEVGT